MGTTRSRGNRTEASRFASTVLRPLARSRQSCILRCSMPMCTRVSCAPIRLVSPPTRMCSRAEIHTAAIRVTTTSSRRRMACTRGRCSTRIATATASSIPPSAAMAHCRTSTATTSPIAASRARRASWAVTPCSGAWRMGGMGIGMRSRSIFRHGPQHATLAWHGAACSRVARLLRSATSCEGSIPLEPKSFSWACSRI